MTEDAHGNFSGKRLVIFGAGYVGLSVAHGAVARGMKVSALTRNAAKARELSLIGVDVVVGDLCSTSWHGQIPHADYVLNCVSSGGGGIEGYRRSYVEGTRSILAWAAGGGPIHTFVYTSSTSVYPQSGGAIVDETASCEGAGDTARVLLEAENLLRECVPGMLGRWFVLRLAGIYGPKRHHLLDQLCAGSGQLPGRADHRLNLTHREDIAAAIFAAFGAPAGVANEIFNVADDAPATKAELLGWLAKQLDLPVPQFTGEPVSGRRAMVPDRVIANAKIKAMLGWRPLYADFRAGYQAILGA